MNRPCLIPAVVKGQTYHFRELAWECIANDRNNPGPPVLIMGSVR
ncbi:unnamed protein product, partial [marine sediment metagenome]